MLKKKSIYKKKKKVGFPMSQLNRSANVCGKLSWENLGEEEEFLYHDNPVLYFWSEEL